MLETSEGLRNTIHTGPLNNLSVCTKKMQVVEVVEVVVEVVEVVDVSSDIISYAGPGV